MSEDMNRVDRELGWDDPIEKDYESSFVLLPEGDYDFEVLSFERGRHSPKPGGKLPACNKAILTLEVGGDQAAAKITHNLFLHTQTEGQLCAFFVAIGQRKHGDSQAMNWGAVVGSRGRCKVGIRNWVKDNGETAQSNEIKRFYEPKGETWPPKEGETFQQGVF